MEDGRKLQYVITFAVSIVTTTMGILNTWATPMIRKFWDSETDFQITDYEITWFIRTTTIGLLVGTVFGGYTCDRFGRRTTILIAIVSSTFGTIFAAFSSAVWMLFVMQAFWAFSLGIIWTVVPIYMAEVVDPDIRGGLSVTTRVMFHFGSLIMIWVGPAVSYKTLNNWLTVLPLLSFAVIYQIPESPYYLLKVGKEEEAKKELSRLQENVTDDIETQFERMKMHVVKEMKNPSSFLQFISNRMYRKALIITAGLKLIYMLSGTPVIQVYFFKIILEGNIQMNPRSMVDVQVASKFVVGIIAAFLVDRLGRRILLLNSLIGVTISLSVIGFYYVIREHVNEMVKAYGYIAFAGIIFFLISTAFGLISIKDVVEVELFPLNVRAMSLVTLYVLGGLNFPIIDGFQKLEEMAGLSSVFWIYATVACIGCVFIHYLLPETKGKSLKEIQDILRGEFEDVNEQEMSTV